jgi:ArsR family transcriptional regulator, virulence genes transcriptional regulator
MTTDSHAPLDLPAPADLLPHAEAAAALLRSLANPQRLMILCHLAEGALSVSELNVRVPLSQSALSQHLARLREAGLVATTRSAQTIVYSLVPGPAAAVVETLHREMCPPQC